MQVDTMPKGKAKSEVHAVPFEAWVEHAREVRVTGDFTKWSKDGIRLERSNDGWWRGTIGMKTGVYQYRLLVDGTWLDHPQAAERIPNPFGSENCVVRVG